MGDALAHRGPDGEGFLAITGDGEARLTSRDGLSLLPAAQGLFLHRRLSIIDLHTGDQPMGLAGGKLWCLLNGEIYNYREVRAELLAEDPTAFRTTSDTEVILRAYARWGIDGLRRLNGMFAIALVDLVQRRVVLARDPVGIKPLYWAQRGGLTAFASEVRGLEAAGVVQADLDTAALATYIFYRFVPAPRTLWRCVHKVTPGHALVFSWDGELEREVDFAAPAPAARTDGVDTRDLSKRLAKAVERQMVADVPVGSFLSGGLDSSVVTSVMSRCAPGMSTYAIGFPSTPSLPSELGAAREASNALRTMHHEVQVDPAGYRHRLPHAISRVEEPLAHPGMLLQSDLAALAHRDVKVVLTGQGADEPLGGYARHQAARILPLLAGAVGGIARSHLAARWASGRERVARVRTVLAAPAGLERAAALFSPLGVDEVGDVIRGCSASDGRDAVLGAVAPWWERAGGLDDVARTLYVDVRTSLAEDLLLVGDKMAMEHALEARVPYLDLEYLETIESIPGNVRVHAWGDRKWLQRAVGKELLPSALSSLTSPVGPFSRKRGFDVPVQEWFRGAGAIDLEDFLTGPRSVSPTFLNPEPVRAFVARFRAGKGSAFRLVLSLYVLEVWLRVYQAGQSAESILDR